MNETLKTIFNRKSVRVYQHRPVSQANLELILKAAMSAPSGADTRPWSFVVIQNKKILEFLSKALDYGKMIKDSAVTIVVCGNPKKSTYNGDQYWIFDCSVASENILLAVESLGLGAVWTSIYPSETRIAKTKKVLNLPKNVEPLCAIPIGYPKGEHKPKDKYNFKNIHRDKW